MANQKIREKRRAERMRKSLLAKKKQDIELQENEDIGDGDEVIDLESETEVVPDEETIPDDSVETEDVDEPEVVKALQKEYGEPYMGPTSFAEADAMHEAHEKAMKVSEIAWTAEQLVRNIIQRPDMSPEKKGKAIAEVGNGFGERVKAISSHKMEKSMDMDLLEIQAMSAIETRHTPMTEKVGDWIAKAVLTSGKRSNLSDEDFALVEEKDGKKIRKYPIHDKAHVRNALARAAQMMEKGGMAATDARKALPKIRAAAKKMGIGMEKSNNAVLIEKDNSGQWRAVLWPTNNFKDLDGEIVSEAAHVEYVEWVNKNMDTAPVFMTWHIPDTARENPIDFISYESGFMIASAPLTENEAASLLKMQAQVDLGLSIGGFALERDASDKNVITKYRMYEMSDLPLERAANPFTSFQVFEKEADVDTLEYLTGILGEEKAKLYVEKAGIQQKELRKAGVAEKEAKPSEPTEPVQTKTDTKTPDAIPLGDLVERVAKELGMEQLSDQFAVIMEKAEKVDVLESLVKELVKSNEDKLVEMITPPAQKTFSWMEKRASQSDKTILKEENEEDKLLLKQKPENWLSEATGTTPVSV